MGKTFFIGDTHFHHANVMTFEDGEGNPYRPEFSSVEEMDEYLVYAWNSVVSPKDKVYHLGDVLLGTSIKAFEILKKLNGRKVLIKGNHDKAKIHRYTDHFRDVRSEIAMKTPSGDRAIFTHRPIYFGPLEVRYETVFFNIHGHIHLNTIPDPRYINISVEKLPNYSPILWEDLIRIMEQRKETIREAQEN